MKVNPTLRGFLIIAAIALVIVVLQLEATLDALFLIARIAFFLAIAFFVYLVWRDRRQDIAMWPGRARFAFYGGALLILADIGAFIYRSPTGIGAVAFILVLPICGFAMFRVWRDQHRYA